MCEEDLSALSSRDCFRRRLDLARISRTTLFMDCPLHEYAVTQYSSPFIGETFRELVHVVSFALLAKHNGGSDRPEHDVRHDFEVHIRSSLAACFEFLEHIRHEFVQRM